ncbi:MAG: NAD(P)-dependent oxidoreductase [Planctomycetes bacterium]|nr:NAD(P)-dependent oxidoreductase [Planctomycetota bacterium]
MGAPECFVVTGAAGFVGGRVAEALSAVARVVAVDREPCGARGAGMQTLQADIRQPLPQCDIPPGATFFHAAASMDSGKPDELWDANVTGTRNVLEWAAKARAKHFIFTSSGGVYGYARDRYRTEQEALSPIGYYGHTKALGEALCRMHAGLYGLDVTVLRLYFPYGPGQESGIFGRIRRSLEQGTPLTINPRGAPKMNPVHVQDVVDAVRLLVREHGGVRTYNLAGDDVVTFLDLVRLFERRTGRSAVVRPGEKDEGDLLGDNSLIKRDLGWVPRHRVCEAMIG